MICCDSHSCLSSGRRDGQDVDVVSGQGSAEKPLATESCALLIVLNLRKVVLEITETREKRPFLCAVKMQTLLSFFLHYTLRNKRFAHFGGCTNFYSLYRFVFLFALILINANL
jgi:hypothetical protein